LETGNNEDNYLLIANNNMMIGKENKMNNTEKSQYQHNGSGTAILINKNYDTVPTRKIMNDHKMITCIIKNERNIRWVLAGIHAQNGNTKKKWDDVKHRINELKLQYELP